MSLLDVITRRKGDECNMQQSRLLVLGCRFLLGQTLIAQENSNERAENSVQINYLIKLLNGMISQPQTVDLETQTRL
jgi:hypothetical protein